MSTKDFDIRQNETFFVGPLLNDFSVYLFREIRPKLIVSIRRKAIELKVTWKYGLYITNGREKYEIAYMLSKTYDIQSYGEIINDIEATTKDIDTELIAMKNEVENIIAVISKLVNNKISVEMEIEKNEEKNNQEEKKEDVDEEEEEEEEGC